MRLVIEYIGYIRRKVIAIKVDFLQFIYNTLVFQIVVTAIDDGYPTSRKASCQLIITVFDTNDNAPLFTNPSNDEATYYAFVKQDDIITRIQVANYKH